jgi:hypothetical protein
MRSIFGARKLDETADDPRDAGAIVNAFLQHKSMKQMQDYLASGRRLLSWTLDG